MTQSRGIAARSVVIVGLTPINQLDGMKTGRATGTRYRALAASAGRRRLRIPGAIPPHRNPSGRFQPGVIGSVGEQRRRRSSSGAPGEENPSSRHGLGRQGSSSARWRMDRPTTLPGCRYYSPRRGSRDRAPSDDQSVRTSSATGASSPRPSGMARMPTDRTHNKTKSGLCPAADAPPNSSAILIGCTT
jgi:hypothetical protein